MKAIRCSVLVLVALAVTWGAFQLVSPLFRRRPASLQLSFLSVSNDYSGAQVALFSLSNCTARELVYMCDGTPKPYYSLTTWVISPGTVMGTNHNAERYFLTKPARLSPHASLVFPVYLPTGVTDAVLEVSYERESRGLEILKEKARNLVESYGGTLAASSGRWTNVQIKQPFW